MRHAQDAVDCSGGTRNPKAEVVRSSLPEVMGWGDLRAQQELARLKFGVGVQYWYSLREEGVCSQLGPGLLVGAK